MLSDCESAGVGISGISVYATALCILYNVYMCDVCLLTILLLCAHT